MSKPITVTRTITETVTIGRLNYEAACPNQVPWKDLPTDEQERWERGAAAVYDAVGPTQPRKDDEVAIIEECKRIRAIWPHLAFDPSDPVVYEFLCELRETAESVDKKLDSAEDARSALINSLGMAKASNWSEILFRLNVRLP